MPVAAKQNRTLEILLTAKDLTKRPLQHVKQQMMRTISIIRGGFGLATSAARGFINQLLNMRNVIIAGVGAAMTKFAADFEDGLAQVAGLIDDPSFDLSPFSAGIRDIAIETGDSFASLNKSLFDTISAGVSAGGALDVLRQSARLAAAGGTDTATAVNGVTNILNAYGLAAEEAARVTDALFQAQKKGKTTIAELSSSIGQVAPLAANLGVSLEEVTAALSALTTVGLSTDEAATQLKGFFTALVKPGIGAADAARELGIEFNSAALEGGRFLDFLRELADKTGGSTEQLARLFPNVRALQGVLGLAKNDGATFNDVLDAMAKKAGSVDAAFAKTNRTLGAQIRRTWRSVQSSIIDVIEGLRPYIEGFLASIRGFFTELARNRQKVVDVFGAIGETIKSVLDAIITIIREGDIWQFLVNSAVEGMRLLGNVFLDAIPALSQAAAVMGQSLGSALIRKFIATSKEELVRRWRDGGLDAQAIELIYNEDVLQAHAEQLREIERLRRVTSAEYLRESFAGRLFGDDGSINNDERIAAIDAYTESLKKAEEELAFLRRGRIPRGHPLFDDQDRFFAIRNLESRIGHLKEVTAELKLIELPQDVLRKRLLESEKAFGGEDRYGQRYIQAQSEQLGRDIDALVQGLPGRFDALAEGLKDGMSEASKGGIDQVRSNIKSLATDLGALAEAFGAGGERAGRSLGAGVIRGFSPRDLVSKIAGLIRGAQGGIADAVRGTVDAVRGAVVQPILGLFGGSEASVVEGQVAQLRQLQDRIKSFGGFDFAPVQLVEQFGDLERALDRSAGELQLSVEGYKRLGIDAPPNVQRVIDKWKELRKEQLGLKDELEDLGPLGKFLEGAKAALDSYAKAARDIYQQSANLISGVVQSMEQNLARAFIDIAERTKSVADAFEEMGKRILETVQQLLAQTLARSILGGIFGAFGLGGGNDATVSYGGQTVPDGGSIDVGAPTTLPGGLVPEGGGLVPQGGGPASGGGGDVYHIHYHVNAIDARSVERLFSENGPLIAAQTFEQIDNRPDLKASIRRAAR